MVTKFKHWFFNRLPLYFKQTDNYKDPISGEGLLERYLQTFGMELDEEVVNYADGYISGTSLDVNIKSVIDPLTCDPKFLLHIAHTLGNPPDLLQATSTYRKLLRYILAYYKVKGTKRSYEIFFALLGWNVSIIEYEPGDTRYDDNPNDLYDTDKHYDGDCASCSDYEILITPLNNDCTNPTIQFIDQTILDLLWEVIKFNEPINANLLRFIDKASICEEYETCLAEEITLTIWDFTAYDDGGDYDVGDFYDLGIAIQQDIYNQDCGLNPAPGSFLLLEGSTSEYITQEDGYKIIIS